MIELTHHPLGMEDSGGTKVEVMRGGPRWRPRPGLVASGEARLPTQSPGA
jgi:hypothetical protein